MVLVHGEVLEGICEASGIVVTKSRALGTQKGRRGKLRLMLLKLLDDHVSSLAAINKTTV